MLRMRQQGSIDNPSERLCILNDLKYPHPELYATFSSWGHPWPSSMSDIVHNIRVLPLPALRKNSSNPLHLPTISLLNIARYALGKKDLGWRTELMNYGTVCRAWTPVLDLFFESVQTRNCKDRPSIMYVARALEQRPDRRTLMWMFLPAAYREFFDNSRYEMFSQTCVRILGLSTELRNIHLPVTTASAWDDLVKVLQSQKGVRRCTLASPVVHRPPTLHRPYSIDDIQTIVGGWEHLRTLRIDGWITDPETPLCEVGDQTYRLKELRLVTGNITGFQLLRFIPSTSATMLKKLHLVSVTGLTNNDLRSLLTLVSPTLKELHIQGTPTTREEPDEPYALDATIADMPHLKSVTLDGDHASALAIARKGPGSKDGKPAKDELRGTMSLVVHTEFEVVHAESVVRALGTTGWKHVMVWWNRKIAWNADTEWDDVDFAARVKSIQARGVHLRFKFFDKSVRLTPDVVEYKPGWSPLLLELY
ncbi:hypothetical protein H0H93_015623 [Arthromyces matolae]|nr:hypothetical protein H0H93_015623 [Arthromyces matolae]